MPRLREVPRSEVHPFGEVMYGLLFGDRDPTVEPGTASGTPGDWWTVTALSPDAFDHIAGGIQYYRSPDRQISPVLRELGQLRVGWARSSLFVYSQHCKAARDVGLTNEWTDAWEDPANPDPLGMPLQFMVTGEAVARGHHYSQQAKDVNFNPVGQIVGTMNKVRKTKDLIADMVDEYLECSNRLERLNERAAGAEVS